MGVFSKTVLVINQETDDVFYHNLTWLTSNIYQFSHAYSYQTDNELVWLSEHCFDIDNEQERMQTSRCIIQKKKEDFLLSWENPFYEKYQIQRDGIISFAPAGNGYWCYNQKTNTFFQDDVINLFQSTLCKRKIPIEK